MHNISQEVLCTLCNLIYQDFSRSSILIYDELLYPSIKSSSQLEVKTSNISHTHSLVSQNFVQQCVCVCRQMNVA